ncbi:MAG: hypothetical protein PSX36_06760 [bacterium]|nr:hypothetical protein [bacterium]
MKTTKSHAIIALRELYLCEQKRKYPRYPAQYFTVPAFSDKTQKSLNTTISAFLRLKGHDHNSKKGTITTTINGNEVTIYTTTDTKESGQLTIGFRFAASDFEGFYIWFNLTF